MNYYLASASPRRKEILEELGFTIQCIPVEHQEIFSERFSPEENCMAVSFQKAKAAQLKYKPQGMIIASDTIVIYDGSVLQKPLDRADAKRMLSLMRGRVHRVISSFCLMNEDGSSLVDYDTSYVRFRNFSEKELETYLNTGEYKDKAGAYGIQGAASSLVEVYCGSLKNIIGLPVEKMALYWKELKEKLNDDR